MPCDQIFQEEARTLAEIGIFVGHIDTPHNYPVYFPNNKMNVVRQDIKFDEEKAMQLSLERELGSKGLTSRCGEATCGGSWSVRNHSFRAIHQTW